MVGCLGSDVKKGERYSQYTMHPRMEEFLKSKQKYTSKLSNTSKLISNYRNTLSSNYAMMT